jgi:hypothetical protein
MRYHSSPLYCLYQFAIKSVNNIFFKSFLWNFKPFYWSLWFYWYRWHRQVFFILVLGTNNPNNRPNRNYKLFKINYIFYFSNLNFVTAFFTAFNLIYPFCCALCRSLDSAARSGTIPCPQLQSPPPGPSRPAHPRSLPPNRPPADSPPFAPIPALPANRPHCPPPPLFP